jgi:hypothetical protein
MLEDKEIGYVRLHAILIVTVGRVDVGENPCKSYIHETITIKKLSNLHFL